MKILRKMKKGFTIVELVIVIAVIAVLTAILVPTFINISKKANKASDNSLVTNLNTALKMAEADNEIFEGHKLSDENVTMHDAVLDLKAYGYYLEQLVTKSDEDLIYSLKENKFYLSSDSAISSKYTAAEKVQYLWTIQNSVSGSEKYSVYAGSKWSQPVISNLHVGFDAGSRTDITSVSYSNAVAHKVIIRMNGGDLTIDAENDTVKHYGSADIVTLTAVSPNSFYENGGAVQVNIKKGRLVLTNNEDAGVGTIYLQATDDNYDNIILATQDGAELPDSIYRDTVSTPTGSDVKTVVTIQSNVDEDGNNPDKVETINLYSTAGATGNDVYEENNGYDVSDLGLLVVEASSNAAKAQAAEQISDPEVLAEVTESKSSTEVTNLGELNGALAAGAKYIVIKNDFTATGTIFASLSSTIDGGKHTITTSATRALRIQSDNVELTIRHLTIDSNNKCERGLQVDSNKKGHKIVLEGVNFINNTMYAINMCGNTAGSLTASNCEFSGWSALNTWGSGHTMTFNSCVLTGKNDKGVASSNNYAVVCLEADSTYQTSEYSSFNTVILNGCTVTAIETNSNKENIVNFNGGDPGSTGNRFITNDCKFNAANKHAYYDGGQGNSWLNNGVEYIASGTADLSSVTIEPDGYTATGTVRFAINGNDVSFNMSSAQKYQYTGGMDYVFAYDSGELVYSLDLDLSSSYSGGYALYISGWATFSK